MPCDPSDIAGMQLWLKADSLALSDNDPVSTWVDSSGSGNDATQAGALRPTYKTNQINGLPAVRFNGTSQYLNSNAAADHLPLSIFAIVNPTDATAYRYIVGPSVSGNFGWRMNQTSGVMVALRTGVAQIGESSTALTTGAFQAATFSYLGLGAYAYYHNGTADGSGTSGQTFSGGAPITLIGSGDGFYWYGDIAELMKYDSVLSSDDMGHVNQYISDKYGLTIANMVPCAETLYPSFRVPRLRPAIFKPSLAR